MNHSKSDGRVSLGNFLEMYDFMVFGYYAAAIGRAFFLCEGEGLRTSVSLTRSPFTVEVGRPY